MPSFLFKVTSLSVASYTLVSQYLISNPQWLGKPSKNYRDEIQGTLGHRRCLVSAHRAGSYENLENTVPAAIAA